MCIFISSLSALMGNLLHNRRFYAKKGLKEHCRTNTPKDLIDVRAKKRIRKQTHVTRKTFEPYEESKDI